MADILIFTGQSNMNGQTDEYRECSAIKNAFEYHLLTDSLRPLKDACGENLRLDYTRGVPFDRHMCWAKRLGRRFYPRFVKATQKEPRARSSPSMRPKVPRPSPISQKAVRYTRPF